MDDYVFVWEDKPGDTAGLVPLVRAANGEGLTNPQGFNYRVNYNRWSYDTSANIPAWTYFYPGNDGPQVARYLIGAAPAARFYVIDIEDPNVDGAQVALCVAELRRHAPVYLSTWGQVKQATDRGIPFSNRGFDGVMPQSYFDYQLPDIGAWSTYFELVLPTFSPADTTHWINHVGNHPVSLWRYGVIDIAAVAAQIHSARHETGVPVTTPSAGPIDIAHYVDRLNVLARDGHLDEFFKRFLAIRRDVYGGASELRDLGEIADNTTPPPTTTASGAMSGQAVMADHSDGGQLPAAEPSTETPTA